MDKERRRYFRINDTLGVSYQCIGSMEAKAFANEIRQGGSVDYLSNFDNRIQTLLESCRVQSPVAAELIELINKKLNVVIDQMDMNTELMHQAVCSLRQVSISACGMAFLMDEKVEVGQQLELDVVLHPSELKIAVLGRVVSCEQEQGDEAVEQRYFLRINFDEIKAADQELLIQHVVKRQSTLLKQMRNQQG